MKEGKLKLSIEPTIDYASNHWLYLRPTFEEKPGPRIIIENHPIDPSPKMFLNYEDYLNPRYLEVILENTLNNTSVTAILGDLKNFDQLLLFLPKTELMRSSIEFQFSYDAHLDTWSSIDPIARKSVYKEFMCVDSKNSGLIINLESIIPINN